MKVFGYIVVGVFGLVLAWVGVSLWTERGVKEPSYVVERSPGAYEVRRYPPYLVAEAEVPPGNEDPLGAGFRMLFNYIRGANRAGREIDMTAPVLKQEPPGESIPMTKPVLKQEEKEGTRVAFVLPADYTLETAPQPENPSIHLRQVPSRRMAVIRFSGYTTDAIIENKRERLIALLERDGLQPTGAILEAYYNPPWTPPFMRRNEVMVPVE